MKKLSLTMISLTICLSLIAQVPESFSYQVVVRDGVSNNPLTNQDVSFKMIILKGSTSGTEEYTEYHAANTGALGIVNLVIGNGTDKTGNITTIDWGADTYFLKVEIDKTGGTTYVEMGTTQLLSVPFALHAKKAENYTETDPLFGTSAASGITGTNLNNWNDAYGWGNHALAGYIPGSRTLTINGTAYDLTDNRSWSVGTVTSVGLSMPAIFGVTGSPITGSGTLTATLASQSANLIFAAPNGSAGAPTFRTLDATDIPSLDIGTKTSGTLSVSRGGTGATTFTSGNVLIGSGTDAITSLSRSGIDSRTTFPPAEHTHGNITNDGKIGSTANRLVMTGTGGTLTAVTGTATGQMLYWDGSAWINVAPGTTGQVLTFISGVPTWTTTAVGLGEVLNPTTGKKWMDRNLGALRVAGSSTDADAYGHLYQWGRGNDGHQIRTSGTTTTLSGTDAPGHANFILAPNSPYDWRNPQNTNLWQGVSGVNNPCPAGYRFPTEAEWNAERLSWSTNNAAGAFASPLKLPVAGYRGSSNGSLNNVGSLGRYWSSTVSSTYSRTLFFSSSETLMLTNYRAFGFSVRCLKD